MNDNRESGELSKHRRLYLTLVTTLIGIGVLWLIVIIYSLIYRNNHKEPVKDNWQCHLVKEDTLSVVTMSTAYTYFIYRDEPMGYNYELAKLFAEDHGLTLNVKVVSSVDELLISLKQSEADVSITPMGQMAELADSMFFCGPIMNDYQVLVQRKSPARMFVHSTTELTGKQIIAIDGTHNANRLRNLDVELSHSIDTLFIRNDSLLQEDLIDMVANEAIDYTIADYQIAKMCNGYYNSLDLSVKLSMQHELKWFALKDNHLIVNALNEWFSEFDVSDRYLSLNKRYYESSKDLVHYGQSESVACIANGDVKGVVSKYDQLFKQMAEGSLFDWTLFASIAYQESRFQASVIGRSSARGLMGIMPATGRRYGYSIDQLLDPRASIEVSISCLSDFYDSFKSINDYNQRLKMALASYNAGNAHVIDAQALAKKYGYDPHVWDGSVEKFLTLKSDSKYYNDPVCKYGYLKGRHIVQYVNEVMCRAEKYKAEVEVYKTVVDASQNNQ